MTRSRVVGSLVFALITVLAIGACSSSRSASGFCARVERGNSAFNSLDAAHQRVALAAFDRVAATAPTPVAGDLHTISDFQRRLLDDPKSIAADPSLVTAYVTSIKAVDAYLHESCGIAIPPPGKLF